MLKRPLENVQHLRCLLHFLAVVQVENFQEGVVVVGIGRRDLVIVKCSVPCTNSDCELV